MIPEPEQAHALERARGLCEACKAGAASIVRRRPGGSWARFSPSTGRWLTLQGVQVPGYELQGIRDEIVRLEVVKAAERNPRTLVSGRIVALCQACRHELCAAPPAPVARNLELGL